MKKILAVLLALVLVFTLVACGGGTGGDDDSNEKTLANIKVCAFLSSVRGDSGIQDMLANSIEDWVADGTIAATSKVYEVGDSAPDTAKLKSSFLDVCDQGWDLILTASSSMCDILAEVAPNYPNTKFCVFDTTFDFATNPYDNVYSASFKANEGSYLAGIVAMSMSETGVIGFVGGQEISSILDFCWGYVEGAKSVNPDGKIIITFTNDWYDSAKAKEIGLSEISMGAKVLFPAAGPCSEGVMEAAAQSKVYSIGVDQDRETLYAKTNPEWVSAILTSEIKDIYAAAQRAMQKTVDGTLVYGAAESLGLDSGCVGIVETGNYAGLSDEIKALVEAAKTAALDGSLKITSAYGKTAEEVQAMKDWANNAA